MELLAIKSFRNVGSRLKIEGARHPLHVHKGTLFHVGMDRTLQELRKNDDRAAELAARLIFARVAAEPTPALIAQIEAELEQDRLHEKHVAEMDAAAGIRAAGEKFQALLATPARQQAPAPARR
jgi:uncharacterized protein YdgA (DUF945 family)